MLIKMCCGFNIGTKKEYANCRLHTLIKARISPYAQLRDLQRHPTNYFWFFSGLGTDLSFFSLCMIGGSGRGFSFSVFFTSSFAIKFPPCFCMYGSAHNLNFLLIPFQLLQQNGYFRSNLPRNCHGFTLFGMLLSRIIKFPASSARVSSPAREYRQR